MFVVVARCQPLIITCLSMLLYTYICVWTINDPDFELTPTACAYKSRKFLEINVARQTHIDNSCGSPSHCNWLASSAEVYFFFLFYLILVSIKGKRKRAVWGFAEHAINERLVDVRPMIVVVLLSIMLQSIWKHTSSERNNTKITTMPSV